MCQPLQNVLLLYLTVEHTCYEPMVTWLMFCARRNFTAEMMQPSPAAPGAHKTLNTILLRNFDDILSGIKRLPRNFLLRKTALFLSQRLRYSGL